MQFCLLFSSDPGAHRADIDSLPDQLVFELFIEHLENADFLKDSSGNVQNISDLRDLQCSAEGSITSISLSFSGIRGTAQFHSLPQSLDRIIISMNKLAGTLDCAALPRQLRYFNASLNCLTGTLSLRELPEFLSFFAAAKNNFSGPLQFDYLPSCLCSLDLEQNKFDGPIDLRLLRKEGVHADRARQPTKAWNPYYDMERGSFFLSLASNAFSGEVLVDDFGHYECINEVVCGNQCSVARDVEGCTVTLRIPE